MDAAVGTPQFSCPWTLRSGCTLYSSPWAKFTLSRATSFPSFFLFLCLYWLFLNKLPNETYESLLWSLLLGSWPKDSIQLPECPDYSRDYSKDNVLLFDPAGCKIYSMLGSILTIREDIPLTYSLPLPTLFSSRTWLLLEHASICLDTDEPHPWRLGSHSLPPPSRLCCGWWNSAPSGSLTGIFLQSWELLLGVFGSWLNFNNHPINHCLPMSPLLGWVGSHKEQKADIVTHSLWF